MYNLFSNGLNINVSEINIIINGFNINIEIGQKIVVFMKISRLRKLITKC